MEKLIKRNPTGKVYPAKRIQLVYLDNASEGNLEEILKALASYEYLGLTPDQIREVDNMYAAKCREVAEKDERIKQIEYAYKLQSDVCNRLEKSNQEISYKLMMISNGLSEVKV